MAKVLVALLRFSPKQEKEIIQKVDEQVNPVSRKQARKSILNKIIFKNCFLKRIVVGNVGTAKGRSFQWYLPMTVIQNFFIFVLVYERKKCLEDAIVE